MKLPTIGITILLLSCNLISFSQFLDPAKCELVRPINEYEGYFNFCKVESDSLTKVYQIQKVILIDINMSAWVYNPRSGQHEDSIVGIDTINAYLIDGIYREYYPNDTLKTQGILATRFDVEDRLQDTINISSFGYWVASKHEIEDIEYNGHDLYKLGKWTHFYQNGNIESECSYEVMKSRGFEYKDEECKGGARTITSYFADNRKLGVWKKYEESGELIGRYVEIWDEYNNEWVDYRIE